MTPAPWDARQARLPRTVTIAVLNDAIRLLEHHAPAGTDETNAVIACSDLIRWIETNGEYPQYADPPATELRDAVRREGEAQEQFANELRAERDELLAVVAQLRGQADAWEMVYQTLMRIEPTFANNDFKSTTQSAVDFIEWQERTRQELLGKLHQVAIDAAMAPEAPDET